jgi:peptidoglycan/LPS O-acetylase OafA/YrhL
VDAGFRRHDVGRFGGSGERRGSVTLAVQTPYARFIDGLRAVAVLAVIAYHFDASLLPGGFTGVDVFFVISGFVVSASVSELRGVGLPAFLAYFYARRLFRIGPALVVCLLVTTVAFAVLVPPAWLSGTNQKTGLAAFFGLSNLVLAHTDNDYFSPRVDFNPFTHTWSLAVEEQFYLVFPWVFVAFLWGRRAVSAGLVAAGFVASVVYAAWLGAGHPDLAFYYLGSRFWELAAGVLLFQASPWLRLPRGLADGGAALSLCVLALGLLVARPSTTPYPGGFLPVLGTVGVIGCLYGRGDAGRAAGLLGCRPMRYVGRISYSLYLWHWPVLVLLRWTFGATGLWAVAGVAVTFGLAHLSYRFVETPPRRYLKGSSRPKIALVGAGLAALAAGYGVANAVWAGQDFVSVSTVMRHKAEWYPDAAVTDPAIAGCAVVASRFRIGGGVAWNYARGGCGDAVSFPHRIFVIGDSHAAAYLAMLKDVVLRSGSAVTLYGVGGCSFIDLRDVPTPACAAFGRSAVADVLTKLRPGDVVFLPSLRIPRIADQYTVYGLAAAEATMVSPATATARQDGVRAAVPVLRALSAAGAKIVFEAPTPVFWAPAFRCADWYDRGNPICAGGTSISRSTILGLRAPVMAAYGVMVDSVPGVSVWDPLPVLCPGTVCSEFDDGAPLFFDGDHLSGFADRLLAPAFLRSVGANLRPDLPPA